MEEFKRLQQEFLENQVLPPSIHEEHLVGLRRLDELVYSTDESIDPLAVYLFDQQINLVASGSVAPYFFLGYVGHGDNSNTVTLNIHTGLIAVMLLLSLFFLLSFLPNVSSTRGSDTRRLT